ncbi:Probable molybdopterin-synthase adenylyltransferase (MoaD protein adenylase) (Molybdopterin-converting factor subunit 1 adenylase) (Sulfur carrier protein MoaD adenylyltransferase) [Durusdinium trenchii]|uniref:Probable molybdopterin-synthase adenylyltransferase (MoaD protein adenylase) (Molybdopterin-converting factor subunit 1 adenylase) (Sulfur carrier protein MoaD adenylyltransferase) n=1 Tax=Durusdinium trenchii TaxID=1381693 RepID=A0ABP0LGS6_9DINO
MTRRTRHQASAALRRLAEAENAFLEQEFLAPVVQGGEVRIRVAGAICKLSVEPADFVGWGVFQPISHTEALLDREATLAERRAYLNLLPAVRLILCRRADEKWCGSAGSFGDSRIALDGAAPIQLTTEVQQFDVVRSRFDGGVFWFDEVDRRHDPRQASYLRESLAERVVPAEVARKGLTAEERAAYELAYWELIRPPEERRSPRRRLRREVEMPVDFDPVVTRLRESLSHAGAELVDYLERKDGFRVRYTVGGMHYTSSVDKNDLTVQVAGICLSGEDQKFDLGSLVGVLREGDQGGGLLRVGRFWYARRVKPSVGKPASVAFDAEWALAREEAWVSCFAKPLLCMIEADGRAEAVAKLAEPMVAMCGAGALGSNLIDNLSRQGFRRLRVVDFDRVDQHNVSTQVYGVADVGAPKVDVLRNHVFRTAEVELETMDKKLDERNARKLLKGADIVIDTFDNSDSRRLVQQHCRAVGIECLHVGLFADYCEAVWDEVYRVPSDAEGDVCEYPLARNLVQLAVAVASELLVRFVLDGEKQNYSGTLRDFAITELEG